jgi:hypothetical protein
MRPQLFTITEAEYFCSNFSGTTGVSERSIEDFRRTELGDIKTEIPESDVKFSNLRDCMLREAERSLFLAISHYRRSLDLMISSSAHWLHVTQYYGTWYSAISFLLMFGCYKFKNYLLDVNRGNKGNQKLQLRKIGNQSGQFVIPGIYSGSHRAFWYVFYEASSVIRRIIDTRLSPCLTPISSNMAWLIERRNEVNYNTTESVDAILLFQDTFLAQDFPQSLSGDLATQHKIFSLLLELTCNYAKKFNIYNDSLELLLPNSNFSEKVKEKIYKEKAPSLVRKVCRFNF